MVDEKESLPRELQETTKLSSNSLKIIQKYQSIKLFSYIQHMDKWLNVIRYFAISNSLRFFKTPLLYFHVPFPCSTLQFSQEIAGL